MRQPEFTSGFRFSADDFRIKLKDAIATPFAPFQLVDLCAASRYTSPLRNSIARPRGPITPDPASSPTAFLTINQNVAAQKLDRVDFEAIDSREIRAEGVCLSAGGGIAFYPSKAPIHGTCA